MHVHQQILERFPVRIKREQKDAFLNWAGEQAQALGFQAQIEENGKKGEHRNLVVGDPERARVIFTAHYDTPHWMFLPNVMMPRCMLAQILYSMLIVIPMLMLSFGARTLALRAGLPEQFDMLVWLVVYWALFMVIMHGPANKHNVNDNTSGVATLLRIMAELPEAEREKCAFLFFDNEEKGKLGSKAYAKAHPQIKKEKLIVNLDCVGNGDQFVLISKKSTMKTAEYIALRDCAPVQHPFQPRFFRDTWGMMNSDQTSFSKGVGICACKKVPVIGYAAGRIHTHRDTVADTKNMDYLAGWMAAFASKLDA